MYDGICESHSSCIWARSKCVEVHLVGHGIGKGNGLICSSCWSMSLRGMAQSIAHRRWADGSGSKMAFTKWLAPQSSWKREDKEEAPLERFSREKPHSWCACQKEKASILELIGSSWRAIWMALESSMEGLDEAKCGAQCGALRPWRTTAVAIYWTTRKDGAFKPHNATT